MGIERPLPTEYPPFFETYIRALSNVDDPLRALSEDFRIWMAQTKALSSERASRRPAEGKWNLIETTRHLADTELVFSYRLLCALRGETQNLPSFDQDEFQKSASAVPESMVEALGSWEAVRGVFETLARSAFGERGLRRVRVHDRDVTARAIVWIAAGHARHHLRKAREYSLISNNAISL